jgi:hypothetical protein
VTAEPGRRHLRGSSSLDASCDFGANDTMATLRTAPVVCAVCVVGSAVALGSDGFCSAGATPARQATGDDYDTFLNPDGTVWVSGTSGPISIRSWQIAMRGEVARRGPVALLVGYRWREDRSDFGLGHKTVTRNGVTVAAEEVTDPERTQSRVLGMLAGGSLSHRIGQRWRLTADGEFAPVTLGRLLVQLPVKYPGEDLVFVAKGLTVSGRVSVVFQRPRWRLEVAGDAAHTRGYGSTTTLSRDLFGAQVSVGRSF